MQILALIALVKTYSVEPPARVVGKLVDGSLGYRYYSKVNFPASLHACKSTTPPLSYQTKP